MSKIVFFDLETTGVERDPNNVRIVEISAQKVDKETLEVVDTLYHRCNNDDVPIDPGATAVTGITEDDVKDCPTFTSIAKEVFDFFDTHHPKFNEWFPTWEDFEKRVREDNWDFKIFGPGDEVAHVFPGSYIIKWGPGSYEAVNGLFFESEYVEAF